MRRRQALALVVSVLCASCATAPRKSGGDGLELWQTNAHGNDIHVIDTATQEVVDRIEVGPRPHGVAAPADGSVVFVTLEKPDAPRGELLWIDPRERVVLHRLEVGPAPNQIACTPDGRWIYVPCDDGRWWVVDGRERRVVETIRTGGRPHNTLCSPDGRLMYLSPMGEPRRVTIVDVAAGHRAVGEIPFADSVRPPALSADGRRFYQQIDGLIGFQVADVDSRTVTATVRHTVDPARVEKATRCHGLAIRPDQKEIWSCDYKNRCVYIHDLSRAEMPQTHRIDLPGRPYWISFTPDGRVAYVAVRNKNLVCAVDASAKKTLASIPVGDTPKRNLVIAVNR